MLSKSAKNTIFGQKMFNVMKWQNVLFLIQSLPYFTWWWGLIYLSSMQKETGLSQFIAEKLKNLYLTTKHEKHYMVQYSKRETEVALFCVIGCIWPIELSDSILTFASALRLVLKSSHILCWPRCNFGTKSILSQYISG